MYQQQGPEQALLYTQARVHDDSSYARVWKELNRADRAVLLLAARGCRTFTARRRSNNFRSCWTLPMSRQRAQNVNPPAHRPQAAADGAAWTRRLPLRGPRIPDLGSRARTID